MINIIGQYPQSEQVLALEGVHLHLYNKEEREGRKDWSPDFNAEWILLNSRHYVVSWRKFYQIPWH